MLLVATIICTLLRPPVGGEQHGYTMNVALMYSTVLNPGSCELMNLNKDKLHDNLYFSYLRDNVRVET